jgi:hypothetical protein
MLSVAAYCRGARAGVLPAQLASFSLSDPAGIARGVLVSQGLSAGEEMPLARP